MLVPKTLIMEDVEIAEEKDFVEEKIDKKVYNTDTLTNTKGGDATDILEQIPSITVDMDGNIELRGDGNVTILIDGRKSTFGSNAAHLTARVDPRTGLLVSFCAIDNLGKGASGQAVQCANIVLGLDESDGLSAIGISP